MTELYIYRVDFSPEENVSVEGLEDYLSSLTPVYASEIQYQKISTDFNVKIAIASDMIGHGQRFVGEKLGNYAKIVQDEKIFYFFVMEAKWLSQSAVTLRLSIDSINTFWDDIEWNPTTHITRTHKDRFTFNSYNSATRRLSLNKKIDRYEEGIHPYLTVGVREQLEVQPSAARNLKWYLIYRTTKDPSSDEINPIRLSCVASEPITFPGTLPNRITPDALVRGTHYVGLKEFDNECSVDIYYRGGGSNHYEVNSKEEIIDFWTDDNETIHFVEYDHDIHAEYRHDDVVSMNFIDCRKLYLFAQRQYDQYPFNTASAYDTLDVMAFTTASIIGISQVNRTDSKLVKIIEIPYPPFDVSDGMGSVPTGWTRADGELLYQDNVSPDLVGKLPLYSYSNALTLTINRAYKTRIASEGLETKLSASEFAPLVMAYGDETWTFKPENCESSNTFNHVIKITYKASKDISSGHVFKFEVDDGAYKIDQNFGEYLITKRDNEFPIYNSEYVNYLKYGRQRETAQLAVGAAGQVFGGVGAATGSAIAMFALGASTPLKLAGAVISAAAATISAASSITNSVIAQREKEEQLKNQAASFSGSNDRDLFGYMTGNKLWAINYKMTPEMTRTVFNMFNLTGYACSDYGNPDFESRYWRNFVQCEAVVDLKHEYERFKDDIVARFAAGVTRLHRRDGEYDFDWAYENWEVAVVDEIDRVI